MQTLIWHGKVGHLHNLHLFVIPRTNMVWVFVILILLTLVEHYEIGLLHSLIPSQTPQRAQEKEEEEKDEKQS